MYVKVSNGIQVNVAPHFEGRYLRKDVVFFIFTYKVKIMNKSDRTVQLLERLWNISDSLDKDSEVRGEGVIGRQPILLPGESHEYSSACHLKSSFGAMSGSYKFVGILDGEDFWVDIPKFQLRIPFELN